MKDKTHYLLQVMNHFLSFVFRALTVPNPQCNISEPDNSILGLRMINKIDIFNIMNYLAQV